VCTKPIDPFQTQLPTYEGRQAMRKRTRDDAMKRTGNGPRERLQSSFWVRGYMRKWCVARFKGGYSDRSSK
jgi:hypothetical protein